MQNRCLTFIFVVLLFRSPLGAQTPARNFEEILTRVNPGDTLKVLDMSAVQTKGKLESITRSQLSLSVGSSTRTFTESQVREIRQLQNDSRLNGFLIGLAAGIGAGFLAPGGFCGGFNDSECGVIVRLVFVPIGAAAGGLSGFIVDHAIQRPVLVFRF